MVKKTNETRNILKWSPNVLKKTRTLEKNQQLNSDLKHWFIMHAPHHQQNKLMAMLSFSHTDGNSNMHRGGRKRIAHKANFLCLQTWRCDFQIVSCKRNYELGKNQQTCSANQPFSHFGSFPYCSRLNNVFLGKMGKNHWKLQFSLVIVIGALILLLYYLLQNISVYIYIYIYIYIYDTKFTSVYI